MWVVSGCPGSGTNLMMSLLNYAFGNDRILGKKFPQEELIEEMHTKQKNETDYEFETRKYILKKTNDEEKIQKELDHILKTKPNGLWETPYLNNGIRFNFFDSDLLENSATESKKIICKVTPQGLLQSNPKYIDKIIYMIRRPEDIYRSNQSTDKDTIILDKKEIKSSVPETFIYASTTASRWLMKYPEIPVLYVYFDDLILNPVGTLESVGAFFDSVCAWPIDQIRSNANSDLVDSEIIEAEGVWKDALFIYDKFISKEYKDIIEYVQNPKNEIHRKNRRWMCCRIDQPVNEEFCLNCTTKLSVRKNLMQIAEQKEIEWKDEPCVFECAYNLDGELKTIKQSIINNSWSTVVFDEENNVLRIDDFIMSISDLREMLDLK